MREQTQIAAARWIGAAVGDYRLEDVVGQSILGPIYAAHHAETQAPALVRILGVPPAQTAAAQAMYDAPVERQGSHIAALRHPYILPLIGYGLTQGLPYLVWPSPAMRSLTTRLAQSGPLDVVTVGRYLDQIAAALEYAHEHATIHRNLSADCIYLQLDGQLVVGDFGVRRLFELLSDDPAGGGPLAPRFFGSLEACAPEQLLGRPADTYTDVYALGAVTYRLLTGQPPFGGETFEALAQRHLRAAPPLLAQWRAGLPSALDEVLATALAKDPTRRFQHPGDLANAYHRVIDPAGTRRVPFATPGGESAGSSLSPVSAVARGDRSSVLSNPSQNGGTRGASLARETSPSPSSATATAIATPGIPRRRGSAGRVAAAALLLVVLVGGGLALIASRQHAAATSPGGTVSFLDGTSATSGTTSALRVSVRGLAAPPAGSHYQAWFANQGTEQFLALGTLSAGPDQTYTLSYTAASAASGQAQNLLAIGSAFEITTERAAVEAPAGKVVLSAAFPPQAFVHIKHLLLSFPTTPGAIGLLVGVLQQTSAARSEAQALQQAAADTQAAAVECRAQSILDILEGTHGAHYQPLAAECIALGVTPVADGFGLLDVSGAASQPGDGYDAALPTGYIAGAADHASLAATTPDATANIRQHAADVQAELAGVKTALTAADAAALRLLAAPSDTSAAGALAGDLARAYGAAGQGNTAATGAIGAYLQGQLMATLTLK